MASDNCPIIGCILFTLPFISSISLQVHWCLPSFSSSHSLKGVHAWTIIPPPPLQRQPGWPNALCGGRVYCGQGEKKNAWGIEVQIRWMENQGPDVWNEKLLRWLLLYISELQFWKFLQKLKQFYRRSHN